MGQVNAEWERIIGFEVTSTSGRLQIEESGEKKFPYTTTRKFPDYL